MSARIFFFAIALFALSACSSLNRLLTFEDETPTPIAAVPAPTVTPSAATAAPVPSEWCQRVATSDRQHAQQAGFDAATLDRMTVQSYQQCVVLSAR